MAEICCRAASETKASMKTGEPNARAARRRRMEIRRFKFIAGVAPPESDKRQKLDVIAASFLVDDGSDDNDGKPKAEGSIKRSQSCPSLMLPMNYPECYPKFGVASVCGRRREMEDAVAIHPLFDRRDQASPGELHYFGVYDGHGCSHVARRCRERLYELVKEELANSDVGDWEWKSAMERSFSRMDKEVMKWNESVVGASCRCELQSPECDAVGSTAVVAIITPDKIVVANCGDSRAVLCRKGKPIPLSSDHKPDRPDELNRIEAAGGRVIYWEGARVSGMLAMSRAIGDNYLKPYVSCEPEVTITDRTAEDECLILGSDGLWDVVSNETACGVAHACLRAKKEDYEPQCTVAKGGDFLGLTGGGVADNACTNASILLTKLSLARHSSDNVSVVVVDLRRAR